MKSIPTIAYLACGLAAPCCTTMVNSFALVVDAPRVQRSLHSTNRSTPSSTQCNTKFRIKHRSFLQPSFLSMGYNRYGNGRSSPRGTSDRTKRQERVGHVVRSELATLLSRDSSIRDSEDDPIEPELRRRINVVHADVSPDLRQARVTVSVMASAGSSKGTESVSTRRGDDASSRRRAYAWLVRNTKSIRHALAARMKHMKSGSPELTFVQVDVGAAVDVMRLIDKVSKEGYKREDVLDLGFVGSDDEEEDGEWEDGDDEEDGWFDFDDEKEEDPGVDGLSVEVAV